MYNHSNPEIAIIITEMKPPFWIDTHCHIGMCLDFINEDELYSHAHENDVGAMIDIGIDGESNKEVFKRIQKRKQVFGALGIHPHDTKKALGPHLDFIVQNATHPKIVAMGEIGLDYYRDYSPRDVQRQYFEVQLKFASLNAIPVIIHSRKAWADTVDIIKSISKDVFVTGVFHCFGYGPDEAKECVKMGFYISFPGSLTYDHAKKLRNVAKEIPLRSVLIETDAPFMIPEVFKKSVKGCLPGHVVETAKVLSHIRDIKLDILKGLLFENTLRCFPKMASALEKS